LRNSEESSWFGQSTQYGEIAKLNQRSETMASNSQSTHRIRKRKDRPNKVNQKAEQKRMRENLDILERLAKQ
jgi:hypothetical protein